MKNRKTAKTAGKAFRTNKEEEDYILYIYMEYGRAI